MKYWISNLFILLISSVIFGYNDPIISLSKVTPEGGIVQSQVSSIIEDDQGIIWFSTYNGLFSYNTVNIKRYSYIHKNSKSISTNRINKLFKDNSGKIWVATENGFCSYNHKKDNFDRFTVRDQFDDYIGKNIISFFQDKNDVFWFSDENGIATFNPITNRAVYKNINKKTNKISFATINEDQTIWVFYEDGDIYYLTKGSNTFHFFKKSHPNPVSSVLFDNDLIWIGYQSIGLICLNVKDGSVAHYFNSDSVSGLTLPGERIRSLIKTDNNQIWVATNNGVAIVEDNKVKLIINKQKYFELPHQSIYTLYKDSNKNIWIGTWLGGLAFQNKYNNSFQHFIQSTSKRSLSSNNVTTLTQVPNSANILVGTDEDDLNLYKPVTNTFTTLHVICKTDTIKRIKTMTYDKFETLWVGTFGSGILYKEKNAKSFKRLIPPFPSGVQNLDILATDDGIWISNYRLGVYFYDFNSKNFIQFKHNPLDINSISNNIVWHIIQDKNQNLWFATENGLNLLKKGHSKFIRFFNQKQNTKSIAYNYIYYIYEDEKGFLWLGTNGEGLDKFNPITGTADHFTMKEGIAGNEIFSILEDQNKNLWLTTENGLCKFNPESKGTQTFTTNKGIQNNHFYPRAALTSIDGELYFGGSNGLIRFNSKAIISNPTPPITTITELLIHNKTIFPSTNNSILKDLINSTKSLKLKYNENSIGFKFISNNYINSKKNKFKYRLKGLDEKWVEVDYDAQATFTNIPPGEYVFEVKAANNNGVWNESSKKVSVKISPPIWLTWYAYLFYLLIFTAVGYLFWKQVIYRQKLKMSLKMSEIQIERDEELHKIKLQLFTNISHEFRTPLTLIQGPVNNLLKEGTAHDLSRKQLSLIKNNTDRLLRLINQFLDFRRIEHGQLKLKPIHTDIISFSKNVFNCFEDHANQRSFNFNFISDSSSLKMDFDTDKLDKVLVNLLSNAFKYSPDEGNITLRIQINKKTKKNQDWNNYVIGNEIINNFLEISITDSGYGISSDELPKIFEIFFQTENNRNNEYGSGIGLSLLTNYVNLHNGQLVVSSLEDKGTGFYIYLPLHQPNTYNETIIQQLNTTNFDFTSKPLTNTKNEALIDNQDSLILITEDNPELLIFLEESLQDHFRIAKAKNGKEGLDLANSLYPDLIISDVMMPVMDGIQFCEKIKNDIRTSHIPFILLTALSTVQNKISGIQSGADAYVSKPFDEDFLITQINNLLNSRKTLRALFASQQEIWNDTNDILDLDKKLLNKAIVTVEKNINNTEFSVEDLARNLNLSRTHLHRKLKSLTSQSATEFIRNIRLKHAIKLMKSGDFLINEIGFAVGFNSHNYFTKAFKKEFGISPSEFIKKNSESFKPSL